MIISQRNFSVTKIESNNDIYISYVHQNLSVFFQNNKSETIKTIYIKFRYTMQY